MAHAIISPASAVGRGSLRWRTKLFSAQSRTESSTTPPRRPCSRSRSATLSESTVATRCTSRSQVRSRGGVVLLPTDLIIAVSSARRTGERSSPLANVQSISPFLPIIAASSRGGQAARSPMVRMLRPLSRRRVAGPTYRSSPTGSGQTFCRKFSGVMTVVASGFFMSLPSLAKTLL